IEPATVECEEPAQLARGDRILEDLELFDVRVAVTAALEQEMAFAEGAGAAEQPLGAERDRVTERLVERRSAGGHARSLRRRVRYRRSRPTAGIRRPSTTAAPASSG